MDAELKAKWVEALRSGKYQQSRNTLRSAEGFCCLGVLCDVMGAKWNSDGSARINGELQAYYFAPEAAENIGFRGMQQEELWSMNDEGKSFPDIADYIEANL